MASVVLTLPPLAAVIFGYQFGVYEDVRYRFLEANVFTKDTLVTADRWLQNRYVFPPTFRPLRSDDDALITSIPGFKLGLARDGSYDARFPLHLAIYEGDIDAVRRILACRPDLAFAEAIETAFLYNRLAIASYLMDQRRYLPQLCQRFEPLRGDAAYEPCLLGRRLPWSCIPHADVRLVQLLRTYTTIGWKPRVLKRAVAAGKSVLADYLCTHVPETYYPGFVDDVAAAGLLPLLQTLPARGFAYSSNTITRAAADGRLDVIQFLVELGVAATSHALTRAAANGHVRVAAYLLDVLASSDADVDAAFAAAIQRTHFDVAATLVHRATVQPNVVLAALQERNINGARWLLAHGFPLEAAAIDASLLGANAYYPMPLLLLLHECGIALRAEWMPSQAAYTAAIACLEAHCRRP
ncbi:hypothetical protein SDRG_13259 [Saprolegnia diclina VS20]|uniref:Ankyrin repeat domain-containing protein n=1 Tax=Saprolegnia diclina (strain VS20) TaxID=1156394 RepID=T0R9X4_SAPDV|nr:hypothetical protein SDRG_13259 [Saprolegnia diclina VS20]EQC28918.1 hypothetical protein SDRG_13259 [Saprolegnia diclina VS20]|eukprot:XP_008617557.1 hypothetical protein SDRG_13259 [Saprolegnia diclina VS20]